MLFNTYEFVFVFLPFTFFLYFYLNQKKLILASKVFLICCSLFFYSWWNIAYLPIILGSIVLNYVIGRSINKTNFIKVDWPSKKLLLIIGIILNLSLLGYFKYVDFFIENINIAFNGNVEPLNLLLPLAISFFTFQQIAYLVDTYRNEVDEFSFLNYAMFVTFFPQLIAGPIVHHKEMMPQFTKNRNKIKNYRNISLGLFIFSIGLFKKVVIADTFAIWANNGFDIAVTLSFFEAWITSLSYSFQLYFDFSGYADMAIGMALLFNIRLPINFNSPYKAINIQDFWRRWHITLSSFIKNYVYIPLGGNRKGGFRSYNNLIVAFIIGGIWHGAGWTFLLWGLLHGLAMVIQRLWSKFGINLWTWLAWLITFNFVNITWIFFRAKEWEDAMKVLKSMFILDNFALNLNYLQVIILIFGFVIVLFFRNSMSYLDKKFNFSFLQILAFVILIVTSILLIRLGDSNEFLYFNF